MFEKGKLIFKFWFQNGTCIEKEVVLNEEDITKEEIEDFNASLPKLIRSVKTCFKEGINGELNINNLIVRCSELIAFDIIPIVKESEANNASKN